MHRKLVEDAAYELNSDPGQTHLIDVLTAIRAGVWGFQNNRSSGASRIGDTPLARFTLELHGISHTIYTKLEGQNAFGSIKDRVAWGLLMDGAKRGAVTPNSTIVEASSGNLGIALASLGEELGLSIVIVGGSNMRPYARSIIERRGAKLLIASPASEQSDHAARIELAASHAQNIGGVFLNQYVNPANPATHEEWTAPECFKHVLPYDAVFVTASSGGTFGGFSKYIREHQPSTKLIVVKSYNSNAIRPSDDRIGRLQIPGFGSTCRVAFATDEIAADIVRLSNSEVAASYLALRNQGNINVGLSSAGVIFGAISWLAKQQSPHSILCVCPDKALHYEEEFAETVSSTNNYPDIHNYSHEMTSTIARMTPEPAVFHEEQST